MRIKAAKDLIVYQKAYALAMETFEASRRFSAQERCYFTDQIRRSSRSVGTNIREAWAKWRYEAHFVSKNADGENGETETWFDFASNCEYLSKSRHTLLTEKCREVGAMLATMINAPSSSF